MSVLMAAFASTLVFCFGLDIVCGFLYMHFFWFYLFIYLFKKNLNYFVCVVRACARVYFFFLERGVVGIHALRSMGMKKI